MLSDGPSNGGKEKAATPQQAVIDLPMRTDYASFKNYAIIMYRDACRSNFISNS
jgi:hypothetical protein